MNCPSVCLSICFKCLSAILSNIVTYMYMVIKSAIFVEKNLDADTVTILWVGVKSI